MLIRAIAIAALSVLALAPQALAMSTGAPGGDTSVAGTFNAVEGAGTSGGTTPQGGVTGQSTVSTPEPLAALVVGLGLIGASYLRRRR